MKNLLLIVLIQFVFGAAFAQEPEPTPEPKVSEPQKKDEVYTVVDEPADYPGGTTALKKYLAENVIYPQVALEEGLQGKCFLQFVVTEKGGIRDIKVKKGVLNCPECDKEAIRVVKSMPKWIPGKVNGKSVDSYFVLPVIFKLN